MTVLTTAFLNVCSLRRKVSEVPEFVSSRGIHLLGIAETWLKPDISGGEVAIPHFKLFRKDRPDRPGGGVAVYCHESLAVRHRFDLESELELLWLEVAVTGHDSHVIGCCYRPPNSLAAFWPSLEHNIELAVEGRQKSTKIVRDFNVDFAQGQPSTVPLRSIISRFNLSNYVTSPTRVTSHSATLLDLLLSSAPPVGSCETVYLDTSDHFAILAHLHSSAEAQLISTNDHMAVAPR